MKITQQQAILEILEQERGGLTSAQILQELEDYGKFPADDTLKTVLCQMKNNHDYLYSHNYEPCPGCGLKRKKWGITEKGLIRLQNYNLPTAKEMRDAQVIKMD
jgi:hypothetical protein